MYDAEIAYTDELIGELFDFVRERFSDTVFVITADHGELFGEQDMLAHKVVADDAVSHVPLVVHRMPAVTDYSGELVQHIDVVRTLLSELGHETAQLQGIDMRETERSFAVVQRGAERYKKNVEKFRELNPDFDVERYHEGTLHALRTESFKYLRSDERDELVRPPDEQSDVSDAFPATADRLESSLDEWLQTTGHPVTDEQRKRDFSGAVKQQMEDLGYLD